MQHESEPAKYERLYNLRKKQIDKTDKSKEDYEFEMSFLGAPSPSLKSLDTEGRVIYAGSFSKSLFSISSPFSDVLDLS